MIVALEDDLDGGPASETVRFGLGGDHYEIDLNAENAQAFRKQLAPFTEHARKPAPKQPHRAARTTANRQRSRAIRAWAKDHGIPVSDRGRFPTRLVEQYETAKSWPAPGPPRPQPVLAAQGLPGSHGQAATPQRETAGPAEPDCG